MNCHETYLWMLEVEEPAAPPPDPVVEHLRGCRKCRRRHRRMLRVLAAVRQLPPPPVNPQARLAVLDLVRQSAAPASVPMPKLRPRPWTVPRRRLWQIAPVAAAALLVLGLFGWLLQHLQDPRNPAVSLDGKGIVLNDGDLRSRLLKRNLGLAEARKPIEQLDALAGMASDLGSESIKQAGVVDNANLTRLAVLYERVLREGVVPRARALPPEGRAKRVPVLVKELRQTERDAEETAAQKPAAAEPLRRLAGTAHNATLALNNPDVDLPKPTTKPPEARGLLVETLVVQGLKLADENDPLKRADVCSDVADSLVRTIMEASQSGSDRREMEKLGTYLGVMMDQGVGRNLDRVDPSADPKRRREFERVRRRAGETMAELESATQDAPPPARPALEQALQASRYATLENIGPPKK
jgi:hypothetical protein